MQILKNWDFGFVHQILSFSRADNESISSAVRGFRPSSLDQYITVQRYAPVFLDASEAASLKRRTKREYYSVLAEAVFRGRESAFWQYHEKGLHTLGESLDKPYLARQVIRKLLWNATNPATAIAKCARLVSKTCGSRLKG
jgi:hypothetical protein